MERDVVSKRVRSRHAAQHRRLNENSEFEQLSAVLPIARAISSQLLDKASVVRLTISCMRLYDFAVYGSPTWLVESNYGSLQLNDEWALQMMLNSNYSTQISLGKWALAFLT
uniref:BHLH domain-containing protein n=1 Tax=Plectus sambesii TaxID=2011161 RepID=A0A914USD8_9BILA